MKSRWQFWVKLFDQREDGTSLAIFRILLGLVILYSLLSIAGAGLVGPLWTDVEHGGMRKLGGNWLTQRLGGPTPLVVWSLWSTAALSALAFTAGAGGRYGARVLSLVLLQSYNALITMNPFASGGYDVLITNALWIMVLAEPTATISISTRLRERRWSSDQQIAAWPRYVLVFQLLLMYTLTGFQKTAFVWTPASGYDALYWIMQDPTWTRFDGTIFAWLTPLLRVGTAVTWHWEQLSILLLLWLYYRYTEDRGGRLRRWVLKRDWRIGWGAVGLLLHINILIVINVGPFSWITLAYYVLLWRPEEWHQFWRSVQDKRGRRSAEAAPRDAKS